MKDADFRTPAIYCGEYVRSGGSDEIVQNNSFRCWCDLYGGW